ncbi:lysine exporter LysO family protein [Lawsonia intracellularis]|uniref:Membrane protein n=1 Tax=Lawsonia intracellularis (strain PHE/MN1-00) TaxID=363253 RepID=Q1MPD6_LAWIP|nr:lysine exporter LysO family protein [Lawsonia intracellularis]AGC50523.1 hypothetical protein LAW_01128 [Lawsonia intracellularis N343]KAA0204541.1 DUF340 domain-containing protein [Lawsonia intracellularis]MBZ3892974.1 lysine exporter LysO family protein [Lawsonia intracellularis]OMQ02329.1 hypothetical protein BW722_05920 [Lawsonia intracellularis]RBN32874.1 lysine exporter LysO family protein [Lawsonia intracellularis]
MRESFIVLACFLLGIIIGHIELVPKELIYEGLATCIVYFMLFTVGMTIGINSQAWQVIRSLKGKILLVPLGILIGTLLGAVISWLILQNIFLRDVIAVASGLGYYSLSSMLVTQFTTPDLGALTLLVNIAREIIAMTFAPLFVRLVGGLGPLSVAAASSELCIPIIARTSGELNTILAIFSGAVLTICVPIIITLLYK